MTLENRNEIKKRIIETLKPFGVLRVSLFGSFAREEKGARDIDILVRLPDVETRQTLGLRWFTLDQELEEKLGMPVDLVSEQSLSPVLRSTIQKDLVVIYEKAG